MAILPLSDMMATRLLNGLLWSRGPAVETIAPVRTALFGDGRNTITTPLSNSITMDIESSRTLDRAGLDGNPDGDARWQARTMMTWYPTTPVTSTTIYHRESDAIHDWDRINAGIAAGVDPAAAAAYLRTKEARKREAISIGHARFYERKCLEAQFGPALDFQNTTFTARLANALPASWGLGGTACGSVDFDVPTFARAMLYDLRLQTSGAIDRAGGAVWTLTPELARIWSRNKSIRGIVAAGTAGAGFDMIKDPVRNQVLTEAALIAVLKSLDGVADAVIANGFADTSAKGSSTASMNYLVGSVVGLGVVVQSPDPLQVTRPGTNVVERKSTGMIEHIHMQGDLQSERYMQQGYMLYADASIGHTVIDTDFGELVYDA